MLRLEGVEAGYGAIDVLRAVYFTAKAGEVTCVMGRNGTGKTTLMQCIMGLVPVRAGSVFIDNLPVHSLPAHEVPRAGIAYVPQGREVFPLLTVTENLESGFACLPAADRMIPAKIYDLLPVLPEMKDRRGGDLSGGQQQQLAIARALMTRPRVLLLDEPTEGIQPNIIKQIGQVISGLRDEGQIAIILVEQFFDFAFGLADEFVALNRGAVVLQEPKSTISRDRLLERVSI